MARDEGIQSRTTSKGTKRFRGVLNTKATGKKYGRWGGYAEAKSWRAKALGEIEAGAIASSEPTTLREEWEAFIAGAEAGTVTDRTGTPYKPATLRGYRRGWDKIDPELGAHKLTDIRRRDIQAMIDRWAASGTMKPSTIRNSLDPLRSMYRRALIRDRVAINPTVNLEVPKLASSRERFATKDEAARLIDALPETERAIWATAFYGGLRRGELMALRWSDIDLSDDDIYVQRGWDDAAGEQAPKTKSAVRHVPIIPVLDVLLRAHKDATGRSGSDLVFGRTAALPFIPTTTRSRALRAWKADNAKRAKKLERALVGDEVLSPIGLHECRHTFASFLIAAGANAKALSVVMGHASISITFDKYGHLMPGGEKEVGVLLGKYIEAA